MIQTSHDLIAHAQYPAGHGGFITYKYTNMNTELVVALDMPSWPEAAHLINKLLPTVNFFKIGLELFCAEGPRVISEVRKLDCRVFLDLKLHDIPRTVERAVKVAAKEGVEWLTVHASGGRAMIEAAAKAAHSQTPPVKILAITVLTSLNQQDMADLGIQRQTAEHVLSLADLAISNGADGLVCSPNEAATLRARWGSKPLLVTPGIRPIGAEAGDQKRIATPAFAARAGASAIVVGRPITEAPDPRRAAQEILNELLTVRSPIS